MNPLTNVKNILKMNEKMLEMGVEDNHGWHKQYKDSAYIFIGGLPYDLTEGDILCVFSQYGEVVNINLVRDKKTGKTKGFCFLCYEDQLSTVLAVDNFNGIKLGGRTIRVDHCSNYRRPLSDEKDEHGNRKEIVEVGCAPKTPSPSHPQSEEDEGVLDLPKKRKKEKKAKKQKKHKEEKLELVMKGTLRNEPSRALPIERDSHRDYDRNVSYNQDKYDPQGKSLQEGAQDHYTDRGHKRNEGMENRSKSDRSHDSRGHESGYKHDHKRDFYDRDAGDARDWTRKDTLQRHVVGDHRVQPDTGAFQSSHRDRHKDFDERRRKRSDKRDYRGERDGTYERSDRHSYHSDRKYRR